MGNPGMGHEGLKRRDVAFFSGILRFKLGFQVGFQLGFQIGFQLGLLECLQIPGFVIMHLLRKSPHSAHATKSYKVHERL